MDHKIIRTVSSVGDAEFQFKCVSPTEAYMYVRIGSDIATGVEEAYYHYTATSNVIEYVFKETGEDSEMFRFEEDSDNLDVSFMSVQSVGATTYKSGFKNISLAARPFDYVVECAETSRSGINVNSPDIPFGDHANGDVRTCLYNPLSTKEVDADPTGIGSNCDDNGASDLIPVSAPLLGSTGTRAWDEVYLGDINFGSID